jgi:hypothetical protein
LNLQLAFCLAFPLICQATLICLILKKLFLFLLNANGILLTLRYTSRLESRGAHFSLDFLQRPRSALRGIRLVKHGGLGERRKL